MPPGRFCVISRSRPDSVGGGVVSEIFRVLHKQTRFAGGGQNFFLVLVALAVLARPDQENYLDCRTFLYISGRPGDHPPFMGTHRSAYIFKERNNINSFIAHTKLPQVWGGHGYATVHRPNKVPVTRTFATRGGALYHRLADFLHCGICVATYFVINRSMLN